MNPEKTIILQKKTVRFIYGTVDFEMSRELLKNGGVGIVTPLLHTFVEYTCSYAY